MKVVVVVYSRSGTGTQLARWVESDLRRAGHEIRNAVLQPRRDLPYPLWLALSCLPRLATPVHTSPLHLEWADFCVLCSPKWTVSCPPVNAFLQRWARHLPPTAFLLTCGGWDQQRYLHALCRYAEGLGVAVAGATWVRQKKLQDAATRRRLHRFLHERLATL